MVIFYYLLAVLYKCSTGNDFHAVVHAKSQWLMILVGILCGFMAMIAFMLLAAPTTMIIVNGVKGKDNYDECEEDDEDAEGS